MDIPKDIKLYEHPIATFWFDDFGILHSVSKFGPRTIEIMDDYISFVKTIVNDQQVCILTDISNAGTMDRNTRDYTATQLRSVYKAMAIISNTSLGNMIGKVFLLLDTQPYPAAMFHNEKDAKDWLIQYL